MWFTRWAWRCATTTALRSRQKQTLLSIAPTCSSLARGLSVELSLQLRLAQREVASTQGGAEQPGVAVVR